MVKWSFPGSLNFANTQKNLQSNLVPVDVLVLESKGLYYLGAWNMQQDQDKVKGDNEYCFTDYPVRKRTVESKPINSDLTHIRVFRPRESLLCQQTTSTYKVTQNTKMFWWKSHPQKPRLEWVKRCENSRLSLDLRCLNQINRSFPFCIFYIPITFHCIITNSWRSKKKQLYHFWPSTM